MWKNIVEPCKPQMTIWRMGILCWIPKATNTHSQYVILIALPLQQSLLSHTSMLRCAYITCLGTRSYSLIWYYIIKNHHFLSTRFSTEGCFRNVQWNYFYMLILLFTPTSEGLLNRIKLFSSLIHIHTTLSHFIFRKFQFFVITCASWQVLNFEQFHEL